MEHKFKQDLRIVDFPVAEPLQVTKDLEAAKKLVKKGWCQGIGEQKSLFGLRTNYCIMGALYTVAGGEGAPFDRFDDSAAVVSRVLAHPFLTDRSYIARWNDRPGRKKSEVIELFDRAIVTSITGS